VWDLYVSIASIGLPRQSPGTDLASWAKTPTAPAPEGIRSRAADVGTEKKRRDALCRHLLCRSTPKIRVTPIFGANTMDDRRLEAIAVELRVWREIRQARQEAMEDLILSAEQAVSRAGEAVDRARRIRSRLRQARAGFGPTSR